ncbi:phosphatidylinositol polyphosphate 5-phosphatase type IV-like [Ptychodera flava]|uniref:phosphatidylinositol polyphosphate 5-phosphatase type IV-like n=1 Tax=Ptychodera flava TaxID=63121 RepID=UPI003969E8E5
MEQSRYQDSGHESSEDDEDVVSVPELSSSSRELSPRRELSPQRNELSSSSRELPPLRRNLSPIGKESSPRRNLLTDSMRRQRNPIGEPLPRLDGDPVSRSFGDPVSRENLNLSEFSRPRIDRRTVESQLGRQSADGTAEMSDDDSDSTSDTETNHQLLQSNTYQRTVDPKNINKVRTHHLDAIGMASPRPQVRQRNTGFVVDKSVNKVNTENERTENLKTPLGAKQKEIVSYSVSDSDSDQSIPLDSDSGDQDSEEEELEEGEVNMERYAKMLEQKANESEHEIQTESDDEQYTVASNSNRLVRNQKRERLAYTMPEIHEPELDTLSPLRNEWQTERVNSAPLSEPLNRNADTMSERSFMSTGVVSTITTKAAKMKSYLTGGVRNTRSLLGTEELMKHFPEKLVSIFIATWNMHEEKVLPRNLEDLMLPDDADYVSDFYVIGLQEATPFRNEWEVQIQAILGPTHVLLHSNMFGVLHLAIYVRRELIWFCSPVEEATVATRPGSMIKTKGAIGLSFNFFGSSFLFITSHFTSGDGQLQDRLEDFRKICQELQLPKVVPVMYPYRAKQDDVTSKFDFVFWCGDMNFRLAEERDKVDKLISKMHNEDSVNFEQLLKHDQLTKCRDKGEIFKGFQEQNIKFFPTYKFDLNSDTYDSSSKSRIPSYTDRILYKSRKPNEIKSGHYNSCASIKISDHRPVYATFKVKIRPGKDNMPVAGGTFNRAVFLEGYKRQAETSRKNQKSSSVCSLQ